METIKKEKKADLEQLLNCHKNIHCGNIECPTPVNLLSLKDESELEDFLLQNIKIDG